SYSFFFSSRRRHTRFSRDWSSDVCSSDLDGRDAEYAIARGFDVHPSDGSPNMARLAGERLGFDVPVLRFSELEAVEAFDAVWCQIGRASCRERVESWVGGGSGQDESNIGR